MARSKILPLFAGYRFLVVVFGQGPTPLHPPLGVSSIKSYPGGIVKIAAAHQVGRDALVVPFAPGRRIEVWFFSGHRDRPDHYTGRRIQVSYEGVEPLPLDLHAMRTTTLRGLETDDGEGMEAPAGVAFDAVALTGASYDAFEDVPQDQWPEWMPPELRSPPRESPSVELPRA